MKSIAQLLQEATHSLTHSDSAKLDAELLMSHVLQKPRTYLYAWPEKTLNSDQKQAFLELIDHRKAGQPIAYLLGQKEFWSLPLKLSPAVLIPRADTEILVENVLKCIQTEQAMIADLGTGSGAIALALASERPHWHIIATDYSKPALEVARQNALHLKIHNIEFQHGNWCEALPNRLFDAIVSNPPYIAENDPHLKQGDVCFEPRSALVAQNNGLSDIETIAKQAHIYLKPEGYLLFEHGYNQADAVKEILLEHGYLDIQNSKDLNGTVRITYARNKAACSKKNSGA
ncbi:MAG: protein-(glutamine-N5) methyltransferase, release factor-specific [Gammaproteobacteria bacterium]|jgi:release factor glutamine methyltransferase|nr:protein-(glutamine-N5) methyltransferase, release factor-specific [Gammaproteobacteria bacterium]